MASTQLLSNPKTAVLASPFTTQSLAFTPDESHAQLSTPQTNSTAELSIPREIISSALSTTSLQSELLRPIIHGTINGIPAYLLRLQFQFQVLGGGWDWRKRIQSTSISVVFEDAPEGAAMEGKSGNGSSRKRRVARPDKDVKHPTVARVFPGPKGWEGPLSTGSVSHGAEVGIQAGWAGLGASASLNRSFARGVAGAAKVTTLCTGVQRNNLTVSITENPISNAGIPSFLILPLILTHHSRRFSMRVMVNASFGFWRGTLARSIPVLGRVDEPLFFDPTVLAGTMETGERGIGGVVVVQHGGEMEGVDLEKHSSLEIIETASTTTLSHEELP